MGRALQAKRHGLFTWSDGSKHSWPQPSPGPELDFDFTGDGLSLVSVAGDGTATEYYRFDGTDAQTGQVYDSTQPRMWGGKLEWQVIGGGGRLADEHFTLSTPSGIDKIPAPGTVIQAVRNYDYAGASQAALKVLPTFGWASQGMFMLGLTFRLPTGFPVTTDQQLTLMEVKSQGGDAPYPVVHLLLTRENIGGTSKWAFKLGAVRIDGPNSYATWGSEFVATAAVTPSQDAYYDGKFYKVIGDGTIATDVWYRAILAGRLKDHAGNVAGSGSNGWIGTWFGAPMPDGSPRAWADCSLMQLVTGRNLGYVTGPSADYIFILNHYNANNGVTGKPMRWYRPRISKSWWSDGPSMPSAVSAIEVPTGGGAVAPSFDQLVQGSTNLEGTSFGAKNLSFDLAGVDANDIVLINLVHNNNDTPGVFPVVSAPAGYHLLGEDEAASGDWNKAWWWFRIAGASEPDPTFTADGSQASYRITGQAVVYKSNAAGFPIDYSVAASGTASGGSTTTMQDSSKSWTVDQWKNHLLWNTTTGQYAMVLSNTETQLTLRSALGTAVASGNGYEIRALKFAKQRNTASSPNVQAPSLTPTMQPCKLVSFFIGTDGNSTVGSDTLTVPVGMTKRGEIKDNNTWTFAATADEDRTVTTATGTRTASFASAAPESWGASLIIRGG